MLTNSSNHFEICHAKTILPTGSKVLEEVRNVKISIEENVKLAIFFKAYERTIA